MIGEPPSFCGADQEMFTWVGETAVAVTPDGGSDTVAALAWFADIKINAMKNADRAIRLIGVS
jgi:hypothetical protein